MSTRISILMVVATLLLSACGTTPGDRGLSGAGIGAAGALTGMATSPNAVNLGKPAWEQ